jgi:hypothetical protein
MPLGLGQVQHVFLPVYMMILFVRKPLAIGEMAELVVS